MKYAIALYTHPTLRLFNVSYKQESDAAFLTKDYEESTMPAAGFKMENLGMVEGKDAVEAEKKRLMAEWDAKDDWTYMPFPAMKSLQPATVV